MLVGSYPLYIPLDFPLVDSGLRSFESKGQVLEVGVDDEMKAVAEYLRVFSVSCPGQRRADAGFSDILEGTPRYLPRVRN